MKITNEVMEKARSAENSEALWALAKENGMELTQEEADAYFAELHKTGELSDDELENVTGGGCKKNGHPVVTIYHSCREWRCKKHQIDGYSQRSRPGWVTLYTTDIQCKIGECECPYNCGNCYYCHYESGLWLCYHPKRQR